MYNHAPDDYVCPLCQIARGELTLKGDSEPDVIYRDNTITALVAGKWWRSNPGHVVIIPNAHIENLYDMPLDIGHAIFDYSKTIALAFKATYDCDGTSTRQHNEPAGNQDAFHFHLHVFPRYNDDNLYLNQDNNYWPSADEKRPYAEKLRAYLQTTVGGRSA
jgi:histidine triad (HIT) family protein